MNEELKKLLSELETSINNLARYNGSNNGSLAAGAFGELEDYLINIYEPQVIKEPIIDNDMSLIEQHINKYKKPNITIQRLVNGYNVSTYKFRFNCQTYVSSSLEGAIEDRQKVMDDHLNDYMNQVVWTEDVIETAEA